jgi:hypothetical protein
MLTTRISRRYEEMFRQRFERLLREWGERLERERGIKIPALERDSLIVDATTCYVLTRREERTWKGERDESEPGDGAA